MRQRVVKQVGDDARNVAAIGMAAVLNRLHNVDAPRLGELRVLVSTWEREYDTAAPRQLLPVVRGNLSRGCAPPNRPSL